jgi:hypothetical protein
MSRIENLDARTRAVLADAYNRAVLDGIDLMLSLAPDSSRAVFETVARQARAAVSFSAGPQGRNR